MAWIGDRRTLQLPTTVDGYLEIHNDPAMEGISFILLTPHLLNGRLQSDLTKGEYKSWFAVISRCGTQNLPLKAMTLFPPSGEQILYADRPRWSYQQDTELAPDELGTEPAK